jgi:F-type H+-transporting ATPase subunit delta
MSAIASRYARALADVVADRKLDADAVTAGLDATAQLFTDSHELRTLFDNPAVPADQKLKLIDALAARLNISREVRNFLAVLIEKRRIGSIAEIAQQFKTEINDRLGFAEAEVVSARDLGNDERSQLEQQIASVTGRKVRTRYRKDASLLGGVMVTVGSTVYDGSVRGQLERMKSALAQ